MLVLQEALAERKGVSSHLQTCAAMYRITYSFDMCLETPGKSNGRAWNLIRRFEYRCVTSETLATFIY